MKVLTHNSDLRCGPPIPIAPCGHNGSLNPVPSQSKLTVGGAPVLVDGDLVGTAISGCATVADPNTTSVPCTLTTSALSGVATKLTVGGKGVLLENVQGQTSGTCGGATQTWRVADAGQSQLTAI